MSETIITVEGTFEHHRPAERGTLRVVAEFEGPDRQAVVTRTSHVHGALAAQAQQLLSPQAGPVTWWSADRMQVWSNRPWNKEGKQLPLVHHARVSLEVKFSDLGRLADLAQQLAAQDGVTIVGIDWALTEATKSALVVDARDRAVDDAVRKATAYARSLGLSSVRPVALADPGMLGDETRPTAAVVAAPMARGAAAPVNERGIDLKPEDITVSGHVHARFAAN
ncbi:MAG TPA: SIMPL domain-containing protein [Plantibacter sp.]|uniref:SIMPL domain-containing protein n=1 Tax=unclassified Plantibacter TaxID=2624265 RepID=UPI002B65786A|nr:SIMPL domain-containing protein [Plantibacter sp.]